MGGVLVVVRSRRTFPSEDIHFALMLLSQVYEALGHMITACEAAEVAATVASLATGADGAFSLHPFVLVSTAFPQMIEADSRFACTFRGDSVTCGAWERREGVRASVLCAILGRRMDFGPGKGLRAYSCVEGSFRLPQSWQHISCNLHGDFSTPESSKVNGR